MTLGSGSSTRPGKNQLVGRASAGSGLLDGWYSADTKPFFCCTSSKLHRLGWAAQPGSAHHATRPAKPREAQCNLNAAVSASCRGAMTATCGKPCADHRCRAECARELRCLLLSPHSTVLPTRSVATSQEITQNTSYTAESPGNEIRHVSDLISSWIWCMTSEK